jgi:hypothetical protein
MAEGCGMTIREFTFGNEFTRQKWLAACEAQLRTQPYRFAVAPGRTVVTDAGILHPSEEVTPETTSHFHEHLRRGDIIERKNFTDREVG